MRLFKHIFQASLFILNLFAIDSVFAYGAPVESRNFEQSYHEENNVDNNAQFIDTTQQPAFGFNEPSAPTQQVSAKELDQPGLMAQIQRMDQELRDLRGQLEVQDHAIKQLQDAQRQQYQDLDKRLSSNPSKPQANNSDLSTVADQAVTGVKSTPAKTVPQPTKAQEIPQQKMVSNDNSEPPVTSQTNEQKGEIALEEQKAYQNAYNYLKNKQYSQAIPAMHSYLNEFPKGEYAVNAHYWLGELYLLTGNNPKAREQFQAVINEFPAATKVSDAILKIGVLDADEGQYAKAKQQLNRVVKEYPNTPAARLASQRLQQIAMQGN